MKVFDKISWHTDAGEEVRGNIQRFQVIFEFLNSHNMLSDDGKEIYEIGIDSDASLHAKLLTDKGVSFCERNEKMLVGIDAKSLRVLLNALDFGDYNEFAQSIICYILGYGEKFSAPVVADIYALRNRILTIVESLPEQEHQRREVLLSLADVITYNPAINRKMGK